MTFNHMIGKNFRAIEKEIGGYVITTNDDELELKEGLSKKFFVKANDGSFQMILDKDKIIQTIFLFPDTKQRFLLDEFHASMGRKAVRQRMGQPDKASEAFEDEFYGFCGGWDRYKRDIIYHFEYADKDQSRLKQITLM